MATRRRRDPDARPRRRARREAPQGHSAAPPRGRRERPAAARGATPWGAIGLGGAALVAVVCALALMFAGGGRELEPESPMASKSASSATPVSALVASRSSAASDAGSRQPAGDSSSPASASGVTSSSVASSPVRLPPKAPFLDAFLAARERMREAIAGGRIGDAVEARWRYVEAMREHAEHRNFAESCRWLGDVQTEGAEQRQRSAVERARSLIASEDLPGQVALADELRATGDPQLGYLGDGLLGMVAARRAELAGEEREAPSSRGAAELETSTHAIAFFERPGDVPLVWGDGSAERVAIQSHTPMALRWRVPADGRGVLFAGNLPQTGIGYTALRIRHQLISGAASLELRLVYANGAHQVCPLRPDQRVTEHLIGAEQLSWATPYEGETMVGLMLVCQATTDAVVMVDDIEWSSHVIARRSFALVEREVDVFAAHGPRDISRVSRGQAVVRPYEPRGADTPYAMLWQATGERSWIAFDRLPERIDDYGTVWFRLQVDTSQLKDAARMGQPLELTVFIEDGARVRRYPMRVHADGRVHDARFELAWMRRGRETSRRRMVLAVEGWPGAIVAVQRVVLTRWGAPTHAAGALGRRLTRSFDGAQFKRPPRATHGQATLERVAGAVDGRAMRWRMAPGDGPEGVAYPRCSLSISALPVDMRLARCLRLRLRCRGGGWRMLQLYFASKDNQYSVYRVPASQLDSSWRWIEVPLDRLQKVGRGFDPAQPHVLVMQIREPVGEPRVIEIDGIEVDVETNAEPDEVFPIWTRQAAQFKQLESLELRPDEVSRADQRIRWTVQGGDKPEQFLFLENCPPDLGDFTAVRVRVRVMDAGVRSVGVVLSSPKERSATYEVELAKGKWLSADIPLERFKGIDQIDRRDLWAMGIQVRGSGAVEIAELSLVAKPRRSRVAKLPPMVDPEAITVLLRNGTALTGRHRKLPERGVLLADGRGLLPWRDIAWVSARSDAKLAVEELDEATSSSRRAPDWMALAKALMRNGFPRSRVKKAIDRWAKLRGGGWKAQVTRHYVVCSPLPAQRVARFSAALEVALASHRRALPSRDRKPGLDYVVRLYPDRQSYVYETQSDGMGQYNPRRGELAIQASESLGTTASIVIHEVNHQYMIESYCGYDVGLISPWFCEGLADYFGAGKISGGALVGVGREQRDHVRRIRADLERPGEIARALRRVLEERDYRRWQAGGVRAYTYSWLLAHYFSHTRRAAHRKAWQAWLREQPKLSLATALAHYRATLGAIERGELLAACEAHARKLASR